jgi:dTDP-4-amino-4,6-dideoxygalactose transaminase
MNNDIPTITIPRPHFVWGQPTENQKNVLFDYINKGGSMSIYGDDGIYANLETWLSEYFDMPYVILTNTGTSALNSAYVGLGIQRGDEVIVPTYTFLATVTPLLRIGAIPVFADADPLTGNISSADIEARITNKTKAIAVTHMWGVPCDMEAIMDIAQRHSLKVLEDCSHAHFTTHKGKKLGTYGDVACFSIGARKTLTSGEGGFMLTADPEVYLRATLLGHFEVRALEAIERIKSEGFGQLYEKYKGYETGFGENYRMHPYSAVMAYALLESGEIFDLIAKRRESLTYFSERLSELKIIDGPIVDSDFFTGAMYGFKGKIRSEFMDCSAEDAVKQLKEANMEIKLPDSSPLHEKPLFRHITGMNLSYTSDFRIAGDYAGAKEYFRGRVSLPTFTSGLAADKELIDQYIAALEAFQKLHAK